MPENIESIFVETSLKLSGQCEDVYHSPSQEDQYFFNHLGSALDKYTHNYEQFLLIGVFNAQDSEP